MLPVVLILNAYHALVDAAAIWLWRPRQNENVEDLYVHSSRGWSLSPNEAERLKVLVHTLSNILQSLSSFEQSSFDSDLLDIREVQELGLTATS